MCASLLATRGPDYLRHLYPTPEWDGLVAGLIQARACWFPVELRRLLANHGSQAHLFETFPVVTVFFTLVELNKIVVTFTVFFCFHVCSPRPLLGRLSSAAADSPSPSEVWTAGHLLEGQVLQGRSMCPASASHLLWRPRRSSAFYLYIHVVCVTLLSRPYFPTYFLKPFIENCLGENFLSTSGLVWLFQNQLGHFLFLVIIYLTPQSSPGSGELSLWVAASSGNRVQEK